MSTSSLDSKGITVVLLPSGELGKEIYQAATNWTAINLLSTALWVKPEEVDLSAATPSVPTRALYNEGKNAFFEEQGTLFDLLSQKDFNPIRFVTLRAFVSGAGTDQLQESVSKELMKFLQNAVPKAVEGPAGLATPKLQLLNLIVAPTLHAGASKAIIRAEEHTATFIASPEDHSTPTSIDTFVSSSDRPKFLGFVLLHLAAVGGIFPGIDKSSVDLAYQKNPVGFQVYMSRVFVSAVLQHGLTGKAVTRVLDRAANPRSGSVGASNIPIPGTAFIPEPQIDFWQQTVLDVMLQLQASELRFRVPEGYTPSGPREIGLLASAAHFLRFSWDKLVSLPVSVIRYLFVYLIMTWNKKLYDNDQGEVIVKIPDYKFDLRDRELLLAIENANGIMAAAKAATEKPMALTEFSSTPELWSDIRELLFGMLDGSNLGKFGLQPPSPSPAVIFQKASDLLSDTAMTVEVSDPKNPGQTLTLAWGNSEEIMGAAGQIDSHRSNLQRELIDGENSQRDIEIRLEELNSMIRDLESRLNELNSHNDEFPPNENVGDPDDDIPPQENSGGPDDATPPKGR